MYMFIYKGGLQSYISEVTATGITPQSTVPPIPGVQATGATPIGDGSGEVS